MGVDGVIRPPPEIRAVADKTASYVAKNGRAFEARILGSGKGKTPKFAFLHPTSPFHAYYENRIKFYENGEDKKEEEEKEQGEDKAKKEESNTGKEGSKEEGKNDPKKNGKGQKSNAVVDPVAKALLTQRAKIVQARAEFEKKVKASQPIQPAASQREDIEEEPRKQHYTPPAPRPFELIAIVAPSSLTLAQMETIQLVAQFTALDGKGGPFIGKLQHREWCNPAFAFCQPRHGHFAYFSALVDAYRRIYVTWTNQPPQDGMIAEIANNVDRFLELTAYRVEYERDLEEQTQKQKLGNEADIVQIDWHDFVVVETIEFAADEKVELAMLPPPPAPMSTPSEPDAASAQSLADHEMEESDEEDETIRVVPSYTPKVVSAQDTNDLKEVIDPITGKSIPLKDMPEHMRIQLLDPKWAEERKKFQEKQKDSNLVSGDVVASNLSNFSRDKFGQSGRDALSGDTNGKKRLEEANRIIREQGHGGPSLPSPVQTPAFPPPPTLTRPVFNVQRSAIEDEPAVKRQRLEGVPEPLVASAQGITPPPVRLSEPLAEAPIPDAGMHPDPMQAGAMPVLVIEAEDDDLMPAEEFAKTLSKPEVTLQVRIPNDPAQMAWNLYGQIVSVSVDVMSKVKAVKQEIARKHLNGMPANKIQLKGPTGFLKDSETLASLNIGPAATLDMIPKTRGGRR